MSQKPIASAVMMPPLSFFKKNYTPELESLTKKSLQKLLNGSYGRDFEKLHNNHHKLFSMKIEDGARLIIIKGIFDRKLIALVIGFLPEHEYEEIKRWNRTVIMNRIKSHFAVGIRYVLNPEGVLEQLEQTDLNIFHNQFVEHGERYIALNEEQEEAIQPKSTAIELISGEAGAGKTLILLDRIARLAEPLSTDESVTRTIWVIVPHLPLKRQYEQEWQVHSTYQAIQTENKRDLVKFLLPEDVYRLQNPVLLQYAVNGLNEFIKWLASQEEWLSRQKLFNDKNILPQQLYQELCAVNGLKCLNPTNVTALYTATELQQVFLEVYDRSIAAGELLRLLDSYQNHLNSLHAFDPNLYPGVLPSTHFIFMDETQNIPPALMLAVSNGVMAMNDSQNINYKRRLNETLLFFKHGRQNITHMRLSTTHRGPQKTIETAQNLQGIEELLHHNRKKAVTAAPILTNNPNLGAVKIVHMPDDVQQLVREPHTAVVCLTESAKNWMTASNIQPLLLFFDDISGLEFENVVIIHPFDKSHKILAQLLQSNPPRLSVNAISWWEQYLNLLKGALTRTTHQLIIVQSPDHGVKVLYDFTFARAQTDTLPITAAKSTEAIQEEFYEQACTLYQKGEYERAFNLIRHIGRDLIEFQKFINPSFQSHPSQTPFTEAVTAHRVSSENSTSNHVAPDISTAGNLTFAGSANAEVDEKIDLTPLNYKMANWVEELFARIDNADNVRILFNHKRAAYILFYHRMKNENCLFLSLCFQQKISKFSNNLSTLTAKDPVLLEKVKGIFACYTRSYLHISYLSWAISSSMSELMACLPKSIKNRGDMLIRIRSQPFGVAALFIDFDTNPYIREKIVFFVSDVWTFLTEHDFTQQYTYPDGTRGPSLLHLLADHGLFSNMKRKDIRSLFQVSLKSTITFPAARPTENIFFRLLRNEINIPCLLENAKQLAPLLTEQVLFEFSSDPQGAKKNLFILLCDSKTDDKLFFLWWPECKKYLTLQHLFSEDMNGRAENFLFGNLLLKLIQCNCIENEWEFLKSLLSVDRLVRSITFNDGPPYITNNFYLIIKILLSRSPKFLNKHAEDFLHLITTETLFMSSKYQISQTNQQKQDNVFCMLLCHHNASGILERWWVKVKTMIGRRRLFEPLAQAPYPGYRAIDILCWGRHARGLLVLIWNDIITHFNLTVLFEPILQGPHEGYSLIMGLDMIFIQTHWNMFKPYFNRERLFATSLFAPGVTLFSHFAKDPIGRSLLQSLNVDKFTKLPKAAKDTMRLFRHLCISDTNLGLFPANRSINAQSTAAQSQEKPRMDL